MIPIPNPPELTGTHEQQLKQMWDYLFQLAELLNLNQERKDNDGSK